MIKITGSIRALTPYLNKVFIASRGAMLLAIIAWLLLTPIEKTNFQPLFIGLVILLLQSFLFYMGKNKRPELKLQFFTATLIFDICLATYLIHHTGCSTSPFFLFYYLAVIFASFFLSLNIGIALCLITSLLYVVTNPNMMTELGLLEIIMRIGMAWFLTYAVGYVARRMKKSETKLLNLLDTLNKSTTELERSQNRMETIYEHSRILGEFHTEDEITIQVLQIVETVLGYEICSIYRYNKQVKALQEIARLDHDNKITTFPPNTIKSSILLRKIVQTGKPQRIIDLSNNNEYEPVLESARSMLAVPLNSYGKVIGVLCAESFQVNRFSEIDQKVFSILAASAALALENSRLHQTLEQMALIDELTGLYNYRYFVDKLVQEKRRAARYKQPLSLIMVDIDWFKHYNDTYGHEAGNVILKDISKVLLGIIRDTDVLCRYGGEEFVAILPHSTKEDAHQIAERVRSEIETTQMGDNDICPHLFITVSVGVTTYPDNGGNENDILRLADQAMYLAKGSGKNRVATV